MPRQRATRLASLTQISAAMERFAPARVESVRLADAAGGVFAADVMMADPQPPRALAARDGWAVAAAETADASAYAPVLPAVSPVWVERGDAMPAATDAVMPADSLSRGGAGVELQSAVSPGEGVVPAGFHANAGSVLVRAGRRLRAVDIAALGVCGVETVLLRRPRILVLAAKPSAMALAQVLTTLIEHAGGTAVIEAAPADDWKPLGAQSADAIISVGGTGEGDNDRTVTTIRAAGDVIFHGLGVRPGQTSALGLIAGVPILALPGSFDAALSAWLVVGRMLLRQLTAETVVNAAVKRRLSRKITSIIGLAEPVLVRPHGGEGDTAEPLSFSASALVAASGWVLVPPESEGYASGMMVDVHPLP